MLARVSLAFLGPALLTLKSLGPTRPHSGLTVGTFYPIMKGIWNEMTLVLGNARPTGGCPEVCPVSSLPSFPELLWQLWVQSTDSLYLPSGGYEPATLVGAFRGFSPSSQQLYEIGTRRTQRDCGFSSRTLQKSEYQNKPSHRKFLVFQCI